MSGCINHHLPIWQNLMSKYNLSKLDLHLIFNADEANNMTDEEITARIAEFSKFNTFIKSKSKFIKLRKAYDALRENAGLDEGLYEEDYSEERWEELAEMFGEGLLIHNEINDTIIVKKPMLKSRVEYMSAQERALAGIKLIQHNSRIIKSKKNWKDESTLAANTVTNLSEHKDREMGKASNASFRSKKPLTALTSGALGTAVDTLLKAELEDGIDCRKLIGVSFTNDSIRDAVHKYAEHLKQHLDATIPGWKAVTSELSLRANLNDKSIEGEPDVLIVDKQGNLYVLDIKTKKGFEGSFSDTIYEGSTVSQGVQYKRQVSSYVGMIQTQYGHFFNSVKSLGLFVIPSSYADFAEIDGKENIEGYSVSRNKKTGKPEITDTNKFFDEVNPTIDDIVIDTTSGETFTSKHLIETDTLTDAEKEDLVFTPYYDKDLSYGVTASMLADAVISRPKINVHRPTALHSMFYYNPSISMEEKRVMSQNVMAEASYLITALQNNSKAWEVHGLNQLEGLDTTTMTREEIIRAVGGIKAILNVIKEVNFGEEGQEAVLEYEEEENKEAIINKMKLIYNNWEDFCKIGYAKMIALEGISVVNNSMDNAIHTEELSFEDDLLIESLEEKHWESWQLGTRNISAVASLSTRIRRMLARLMQVDADGDPICDPYGYGMYMYIDDNLAVNSMLDWFKNCNTLSEMIEILELKSETYPWVKEVLNLLGVEKDENGKENPDKVSEYNTVRSQFFQCFRKDFTIYSAVHFIQDKKTGKTIPKIQLLNTNSKDKFVLSSVKASMYSGRFSLVSYAPGSIELSGVVQEEAITALEKMINEVDISLDRFIRSKKDSPEYYNKFNTLATNLNSMFIHIGIDLDMTTSRSIIRENTSAIKDILKEVRYIKANMSSAQARGELYSPFSNDDIYRVVSNYNNISSLITPYIPDSIESSIYENGKMYYSFVAPSNLGNTITKLANKNSMNEEDYKDYLYDNYLFSRFFNIGSRANPTIISPWLNELYDSTNMRNLLDHKVQLHSNHVAYKEMSKIAYAQSLLLEFFYDKADKGTISAWYRVPILSNKPSSEFIKFIRYKGQYKSAISDKLYDVLQQEILRIITVLDNAKSDSTAPKTEHFDLNFSEKDRLEASLQDKIDNDAELQASDFAKLNKGAEFKFLEFLNKELRDKDSDLGKLLRKKINNHSLEVLEENNLENLFKSSLQKYMEEAVKTEYEYLESIGLMEMEEEGLDIKYKYLESILPGDYKYYLGKIKGVQELEGVDFKKSKEVNEAIKKILKNENRTKEVISKIKNAMEQDLREAISEYIWNDSFAALNIIQLTVGDLAFFKNTEDFQKRFAQVHSPGLKLNTEASFTDEDGSVRKYSEDGINRTAYISDNIIISDAITNISLVFDEKINSTPRGSKERAIWENIKSQVISDLNNINATDGQAYSAPTATRKKLAMQGKWDARLEEAWKRIKNGNYNLEDLQVLMQPSKPFNPSYEKVRTNSSSIPEIKRAVQHKNSEYTLVIADALLGNSTNSVLKVLFDIMEESAYDNGIYNGKGIDTIMFGSCVKVGNSNVIDISKANTPLEIRDILKEKIWGGSNINSNNYNYDYVHATKFEDYEIQQEVPAHFMDHEQLLGSQFRILSLSDMDNPEARYSVYDEYSGSTINMDSNALKDEAKKLIALNIKNSFDRLIKDFGLDKLSGKKRNEKLSEILKDAIAKDARYGYDLYLAVELNEDGEFNIPLNDPIQSIRIQQLLNSIIKSRINKQTVTGGPIVQTTGYGLREDLSMRWRNEKGELLDTFTQYKETHKGATAANYKAYLKKNKAQFAYFECYLPIQDSNLKRALTKSDGSLMTMEEAVKAGIISEEQRKAIGYRIPTEDKYSMMPMYIKGFMPSTGGEAIMLPKEITALTGADFDIDKMYTIMKSYDLNVAAQAPNIKSVRNAVSKFLNKDYLKSHGFDASLVDNTSIFNDVLSGKFVSTDKNFSGVVMDRLYSESSDANFLTKNLSEESPLYKDNKKYEDLVNAFIEDYYNEMRESNPIHVLTKPQPGSKEDINNRLFNLQWAALTNNDTLTKLFRPQSFEEQRHTAKIINAAKNSKDKRASYKEYSKKEDEELDKIAGNKSNTSILLNSTQIKYHSQNMIAGSLIGIFANNNVSHAFIQDQDIKLKFKEDFGFTFDGVTIDNEQNNSISNIRDREGDLISRRIASYLGASVDAVKDPILNYLNLNTATANVAMLLTRLGFDSDSVGLFLTQPILEKLCAEYFKRSNEGYVSMGDLIDSMFSELKNTGYDKLSDVKLIDTVEDFTKESMFKHLMNANDDSFSAKVLALFKTLHVYSQHLGELTFMTKFNSVSNAVGPTIADTMVKQLRVQKFKDLMNSENAPFSANAANVIENDPILNAFYSYTMGPEGAANRIFMEHFPHYSSKVKTIIDLIVSRTKSPLDAKTINTVVNDFMYFCLTDNSNGTPVIDGSEESRNYYIYGFPVTIARDLKFNNSNPILASVSVSNPTNKVAIPVVETRVGNYNTAQQEAVKASWADELANENSNLQQLAYEKAIYMIMKNGFNFSPRGDMHLLGTAAKQLLGGYIDALRRVGRMDDVHVDESSFIDQLMRNRHHINKLVPSVRFPKYIENNPDSFTNAGGILTVTADFSDLNSIIVKKDESGTPIYINYIKYKNKLYKLSNAYNISEEAATVEYTEISTLGVSHKMLEYNASEGFNIETVINKGTTQVNIADNEDDQYEDYYDEVPYFESSEELLPAHIDDAVIDTDKIVEKKLGPINNNEFSTEDMAAMNEEEEDAIEEIEELANNGKSITSPSEIIRITKLADFYNDLGTEYIATIEGSSSSKTVKLVKRNVKNMNKASELKVNVTRHTKLLSILRGAGFDISIGEELPEGVKGVFDPTNSKKSTEGLITVLKFTNEEAFELAFPEEYAHFIIEGLSRTPLVQRVLNIIENNNLAETILGEEYDHYKDLYKGNTNLLVREAAGKLLTSHINGEFEKLTDSLNLRIMKMAFDGFKTISKEELLVLLNDVNTIGSYALSEDIILLINKDAILEFQDKLYQVDRKVLLLQRLAERGLNAKARRMRAEITKKKGGFSTGYSKTDVKAFKRIAENLDKARYISSISAFLSDATSIMKQLSTKINAINIEDLKGSTNYLEINKCCALLNSIKEFELGYSDVIVELMSLPSKMRNFNLSEEEKIQFSNIAKRASEINSLMATLVSMYKEARFNTSYAFLRKYWGEDEKVITIGKHKGDVLSLELLLNEGLRDLNIFDRYISSMSDVNDPLLSTLDKSVKLAQANRDRILRELLPTIKLAHLDLIAAGENSKFMFELDLNGVPTGRYISNINYDKYYKERREHILSLKDEGLKGWKLTEAINAWETEHCERVLVDPSYGEEGRWEIRPKEELYPSNALKGLNSTQRKYYDFIMDAKAKIDSMIPHRYVLLHKAVQMRADTTEALLDNSQKVKGGISSMYKIMKEKFMLTEDDSLEFGEEIEEKESTEKTEDIFTDILELENDEEVSDDLIAEEQSKKKLKNKFITLDASGKRRMKKLPVFYTRMLKDKSRLTMDLTGSLIAYTGMAVNYSEFSKIIDCLEIVKELLSSRKVKLLSGDLKYVETYKVLNRMFSDDFTDKGRRIIERLDDYFDSVIYGLHKKDEGNFRILGKQISAAKTIDSLKDYSGKLGLALNVFSGISNLTIGKTLLLIESIGGNNFTYKDMAKAKVEYYKLLRKYIEQSNAVNPDNRLKLLMDRFDVTDSFYNDLHNNNVYNSSVLRLLDNSSLMFLNSAGEHYLRNRTMLSMLYNYKVYHKDTKQEKSLYDVLEVKEIYSDKELKNVVGKKIVVNSDYLKKIKGKDGDLYAEITEDDLDNLRLKISKVNGALNGLFGETDKGAIHRYALGRLAMLFRQWMPGHYYRRFAGTYYDASADEFKEGFYRTLGRFMQLVGKDALKAKFTVVSNWKNLNDYEKANMMKAFAEIAIFVILSALCGFLGPVDDWKKGPWAERMLAYTLLRMRMEVGASTPIAPTKFVGNITSILNSPAAAVNAVETLGDAVSFWNATEEIHTGRWAGWNKWARAVVRAVPTVDKTIKLVDLGSPDGRHMFAMYE